MSSVFPRRFDRAYPRAVRGEGVYVYDHTGKCYIDACGGSAVVTIGHGVREIVEAIAKQASELAYTHSSEFTTEAGEELAGMLCRKVPGSRIFFTSGGSEATETAIKIVRQYWLSRGQPDRFNILSRWHSYHGATLGALSVSGNVKRREPYLPLLSADGGHVSACFCRHCPLHLEYPGCDLACARELNGVIGRNTAGFILEPIVGASSGAVPPQGYLKLVREICNEHDILLVADEVMTGAGRTGRYFGMEHWDVTPDIILLGKGLASGYMPLGAVLVTEKVWKTIEQSTSTLEHGFTYQAHPPSVAAGLAVQRYLEKHSLVERSRTQGDYLGARLQKLLNIPAVIDVRGKGLMQTVEFADEQCAQRVSDKLRQRGVLVYPSGDHFLIAPPFVIENHQIDTVVNEIAACSSDL